MASLEQRDHAVSPSRVTRVTRVTVSDLALGLAVFATTIHGAWVWRFGYSPTRDLFITLVLTGTAVVLGFWRELSIRRRVTVISFTTATWIGYMIWVASVGSVVASNTWREWLLATGFLLFGVSLGRKRWPGWSSVFVFLALLLGVYQALALILARDRLASTLEGPGEFYSDRPMSASLALIMVLGFVLLLSRPRPRTNVGDLVGAGFLGISAVLSQHRSVWVSLFIAVILLAWGNVRRGRVGRGWLLALMSPIGYAGLALVLSSTVAISLFPGGNVTAVGSVGVPESAASTATVAWRWEMWESRLTASRSLMEWLFGCVFGVSPVKWPGTEVMNGFISGHNAMVDTITMYGLVGLVVVCTMLWQAVGSPRMLLSPAGIFVCASLGFSVFYTLPSWSWLVIGVALAYASTGRSSPDGGRVADRESLLVGDP